MDIRPRSRWLLVLSFTLFVSTCSSRRLVPSSFSSGGAKNRIIGGVPAGKFLTRHMANIVVHYKDASYTTLCSATVIQRQWLMTAAHCFLGPSFTFTGSAAMTYAFVGESSSTLRVGNTLKKPYWVKHYLVHKLYQPGTRDHRSDIALVFLDRPIARERFSKVKLARIYDEAPKPGTMVSAAGYGTLDSLGTPSNQLMKTNLMLKGFKTCANREPILFRRHLTDTTQICAVSEHWPKKGVTDTCFGDSGGPLFIYDKKRNAIVQFGITSFGTQGCATPGSVAWYTRVSHYHGLIQQGMRGRYNLWKRYA